MYELAYGIRSSEILKYMEDNELFTLASDLLNGLHSKTPHEFSQHSIALAESEYKSNTPIESMRRLSRDVFKECTYRTLLSANKKRELNL